MGVERFSAPSQTAIVCSVKEEAAMKNLKSMSLDELMAHRDELHRHINKRIAAEREELEAKLARLDGHGELKIKRRRKVAAKYRDPKSKQTWAGRNAPLAAGVPQR